MGVAGHPSALAATGKRHAARSAVASGGPRGPHAFGANRCRDRRRLCRALGKGLLPQRHRRHPRRQDAQLLRRPDQGQGLRHQLSLHELQGYLSFGDGAAGRAAGEARRQHGSRHLFLFAQHRSGDRYARTAQAICGNVSGRSRLAVLDRQAGGHPRHPLQAGRPQPGSERAPQRDPARQRGHGRVGQEQRAGRPRQPGTDGARHGPEVASSKRG